MPGTPIGDDIGPPFAVYECDSENRPGGNPVERFKYAKDALEFQHRHGKLYAIRYRSRFHNLLEFKKLVDSGEIV